MGDSLQSLPFRLQHRLVVQGQVGDKGVKQGEGLVLRPGVGQGVFVGDQDVVVIPLLLQLLIPHRHPGGEVQGNGPLGGDIIVFLPQCHGKHRSGIGLKGDGSVRAADRLAGAPAHQGDASGDDPYHQAEAGGQSRPSHPSSCFTPLSGLQGRVDHLVVQVADGLKEALALLAHSTTPSFSRARRRLWRSRRSRWASLFGEQPSPAASSFTASPHQ